MDRDKELLSKEQLMAVFRERLTTAIKDKKLNFNKLAQMVGISASAMYQYTHEKNGTLPSMEIFYKLVTALEVSADYLLGLVDYPNSIISDQVDQDTKEEIELIRRAYKKMTEREQNLIRGLVADVIEEDVKRYSKREHPKERVFRLIRGDKK